MKTKQEQYVVNNKGHKTAVILSLTRYEQLMEDLHDLAIVAERREEEPFGLEEMKQRLQKDGLL
jgi:PHD/YefM family antitoxin component YafN of YafNO toxin-antitoxin module